MADEKKGKFLGAKYPGPGSLYSLLQAGPSAIRMQAAANGHRSMEPVPTIEDTSVTTAPAKRPVQAKTEPVYQPGILRRGQIVKHKPTGKKVTILKAGASTCEVVDSTGKKWEAKISNLQ